MVRRSSYPQGRLSMLCMVLAILVLACGEPRSASTVAPNDDREERSVEVLQELRFGQAENKPGRVLGDPVAIRTDSAGLIYVADQASMSILVYDPRGAFVRRLGGRGRGPGRFMNISCLDLVDQEVIVADSVSRRVTALSLEGDLIWHRSMPESMSSPQWMRRGDGRYLFVFTSPRQTRGLGLLRGFRRSNLFHLYNVDLTEKEAEFGAVAKWFDRADSFEQVYAEVKPGSAWFISDDSLVFAPSLYRGRVYRLRKSGRGWKQSDEWEGFLPEGETVRMIAPGADRAGGMRYAFATRHRPQSHRLVRHESRGVFATSGGEIVHFLRTTEDKLPRFGVQRFSRKGDFLGYQRIAELPTEYDEGIVEYHALWMDARENFYLVARKNFSEVIVLRLSPRPAV